MSQPTRAAAAQSQAGPLAPYRVLDLTTERGWMSGKILADLGAQVLKVEPGSPALQMQRRYTTSDSEIAQVTVNTHPAARFRHSMTMRRVKG